MKHASRPAVHQIRIAFLSGTVMFSGPDGGLFGRFRAENPIVSVAYLGGRICGLMDRAHSGLDDLGREANQSRTRDA